jgi:hypothetical protein
MVAKEPPRPFVQGALDGLCGVYSIINGLAWALRTYQSSVDKPSRRTKPLTDRESEELFASLISALLKRKRRGATIVDGLHSLDISYLLRESALWLRARHQTELDAIRPFYHRRRISTQRVLQRLRIHLSTPGGAAFIGIESPWKHWTVAISLNRVRLQLLDSDGLGWLSLGQNHRHCDAETGPIRPSGIFFFSVRRSLATRFH